MQHLCLIITNVEYLSYSEYIILGLLNDKRVVTIYENSDIYRLYDGRIRTRGNR